MYLSYTIDTGVWLDKELCCIKGAASNYTTYQQWSEELILKLDIMMKLTYKAMDDGICY